MSLQGEGTRRRQHPPTIKSVRTKPLFLLYGPGTTRTYIQPKDVGDGTKGVKRLLSTDTLVIPGGRGNISGYGKNRRVLSRSLVEGTSMVLFWVKPVDPVLD